jgi:cobalamin biosynthesis protein CobD/CbiB
MTVEELKHVWDNPNSTILEKTVAGALRKSLEKGNLESVETLINRVYGKPKEKIDVETKGVSLIKIEIVKNNSNEHK